MTNKSLSQQLCEACGIEPIKLYGCEFKNLSEYGIGWGVDVCPASEDESIKCEQCKHSKVAGFLYPDFENNNDNFIKLMELEIPHKNNKTITLFNISEYYVTQYIPRTKIDYLICLLTFLIDSDNNKSKMLKIKEIIRQTTWEV